jgi:hypothetical protein
VIYSLILDDADPAAPRAKVREKLDEVLAKPLKAAEVEEFEHDRMVRANIAQMEKLGDRFAARPRTGPPPRRPGVVPPSGGIAP